MEDIVNFKHMRLITDEPGYFPLYLKCGFVDLLDKYFYGGGGEFLDITGRRTRSETYVPTNKVKHKVEHKCYSRNQMLLCSFAMHQFKC